MKEKNYRLLNVHGLSTESFLAINGCPSILSFISTSFFLQNTIAGIHNNCDILNTADTLLILILLVRELSLIMTGREGYKRVIKAFQKILRKISDHRLSCR